MSREVSTSGTAKHKSQTRRARIIRMVWGTEAMVCGKGYFVPNLSVDYKEKGYLSLQICPTYQIARETHPRATALHPLNRAKPSAEQRNILFLFTYVQLST